MSRRCLAGARAAGARIVGKTNLHELAMLPIGANGWFGTPVNPLDASLIPGGSMAATVDGLIAGMRLLEPGFTPAGAGRDHRAAADLGPARDRAGSRPGPQGRRARGHHP
jgi:amidase